MSRYRKIEVRTWSDEKFRSLSKIPPCGQGLWFFLLTGPHTSPIPGLFRGGRAGLSEELNWSLEAFDEAFREVFSKGMVKADFGARLVWLPNALKYNKPESPNVVKSWRSELDLLPECSLKFEAIAEIQEILLGYGEAYAEAFKGLFTKEYLASAIALIEAHGEPSGKASGKPSAKPSAKPSGKAMPNQEQEQEQEQEQDITAADAAVSGGEKITKLAASQHSPPVAISQWKSPMTLDWHPGVTFVDRCLQSGVDPERIPRETLLTTLGEFRSYWLTRNDANSQSSWEHKFLQRLMPRHSSGELYAIGKSNTATGVSGIDWNDTSWFSDEFEEHLRRIERGEDPGMFAC